MNEAPNAVGVHPPQQARSRAALRKILTAADDVLTTRGADSFTMAAVAEGAGVSIGAIYRRFDGKEQLLRAVKDHLLSELEVELDTRLRTADPDLRSKVYAFAHAIAGPLATKRRLLNELWGRAQAADDAGRAREALDTTRRLLEEALEPHFDEILRSDPHTAVLAAHRMVTGASIHHAAASPLEAPAESAWFADQLAEMAVAYLSTATPADERR